MVVLESEPTIGRLPPESAVGNGTCQPVALPVVVNLRSVPGKLPDVATPSPYRETTGLPGVNCASTSDTAARATTHHVPRILFRNAARRGSPVCRPFMTIVRPESRS